MQIWRVNVRTQTLTKEPVPVAWERLGGRGLLARILLDEVEPTCEPLGPKNKLIFAPGLLVGHMLSSNDRISIGGKSPLTGGVKEANAGGTTGLQMTLLGIKALIIEDMPAELGFWVLHLSLEGAKWERAEGVVGLGVYASASKLVERYGLRRERSAEREKVAMALIGPSGEQKLLAAGIQNLDKESIPSRIAARGGLGAVMGAKGLKAIIFDAKGGQKPSLANPEAYKTAQKEFTQALLAHPQTALYRDYGTQAMPQMTQGFGALPTRNFSSGTFEQVETISGEYMRDLLLKRDGESNTTHACMPGCAIRCSNVFGGEDGKTIVSPLEYETVGLMGSNLGIGSLDVIARLNWEANDQGLDSIDTGAALGVACEAGLMQFGDGYRALELLGEIRKNTPLLAQVGGFQDDRHPALPGAERNLLGRENVLVSQDAQGRGQPKRGYRPWPVAGDSQDFIFISHGQPRLAEVAAQGRPGNLGRACDQHHQKFPRADPKNDAADDLFRALSALAGSLFERSDRPGVPEDAMGQAEGGQGQGNRRLFGHKGEYTAKWPDCQSKKREHYPVSKLNPFMFC